MELGSLICLASEKNVTEVATFDSLANKVASVDDVEPVEQLDDDGEKEFQILSAKMELDVFFLASNSLKRH